MMRGAAITVGGIAILMLRELMLAYAAVVIYSGFRLASAPPIGHGQDDDLGGNSIIRTVRTKIQLSLSLSQVKAERRATRTGDGFPKRT